MDLIKHYTVFGLLSPAVFAILWFAATQFEPSWVLGQNSLSELGICGNASAEVCFNMGCTISGMLGLVYCIGLLRKKGPYFFIGLIMVVGVFALSGVGVLNLNYNFAHETTSSLYGLCAYVSMILSMLIDLKDRRYVFGAITAVLVLICILSDIEFTFQAFEPIGITCTLVWVVTQSIKFIIDEGIRGEKIATESAAS